MLALRRCLEISVEQSSSAVWAMGWSGVRECVCACGCGCGWLGWTGGERESEARREKERESSVCLRAG